MTCTATNRAVICHTVSSWKSATSKFSLMLPECHPWRAASNVDASSLRREMIFAVMVRVQRNICARNSLNIVVHSQRSTSFRAM
jgi:hypothetical protein